MTDREAELTAQIEALQQRVAELERLIRETQAKARQQAWQFEIR